MARSAKTTTWPTAASIIIATDRLSAFDVILTTIPYKGQVLTQTARYWFEETATSARTMFWPIRTRMS